MIHRRTELLTDNPIEKSKDDRSDLPRSRDDVDKGQEVRVEDQKEAQEQSSPSEPLMDDIYMEKVQWDQLTLGTSFTYASENYFDYGLDGKERPREKQHVINLFEYLMISNIIGFSSNEKLVKNTKLRKNIYIKLHSDSPFKSWIKSLFYTIPNPFLAHELGWGPGGIFLATINGLIQIIPALVETLLLIIGVAISSAYRNCRETMLDSSKGWWRIPAFFGYIIFGALNIAALGIFCIANSINYARKLIDSTLNLFFNFMNVSPLYSLKEAGKNIIRLIPAALAIVFIFIAPPVGLYIAAKAHAISSAFGSALSWLGVHVFHQTAAVATVHAHAAAAPVAVNVTTSAWQMTRNFGNKLLLKWFGPKPGQVTQNKYDISRTQTTGSVRESKGSLVEQEGRGDRDSQDNQSRIDDARRPLDSQHDDSFSDYPHEQNTATIDIHDDYADDEDYIITQASIPRRDPLVSVSQQERKQDSVIDNDEVDARSKPKPVLKSAMKDKSARPQVKNVKFNEASGGIRLIFDPDAPTEQIIATGVHVKKR